MRVIVTTVAAGMVALGGVLAGGLTGSAPANAAIYEVDDHPYGNARLPTYVLRLDDADFVHLFTEYVDSLTFRYGADGKNPQTATLEGQVRHAFKTSQNGTATFGGVYNLEVDFFGLANGNVTGPLFRDGAGSGPDPWWDTGPGGGSGNQDERQAFHPESMVLDLLANSNDISNSEDFLQVDRVYYEKIQLTLEFDPFAPESISEGDTFSGSEHWVEFPDPGPSEKRFFLQKNHRISTDPSFAGPVGGNGWLQTANSDFEETVSWRPSCCQDLLFVLGPERPPGTSIPEPTTLGLLGLGLASVAAVGWRRRNKAARGKSA